MTMDQIINELKYKESNCFNNIEIYHNFLPDYIPLKIIKRNSDINQSSDYLWIDSNLNSILDIKTKGDLFVKIPLLSKDRFNKLYEKTHFMPEAQYKEIIVCLNKESKNDRDVAATLTFVSVGLSIGLIVLAQIPIALIAFSLATYLMHEVYSITYHNAFISKQSYP